MKTKAIAFLLILLIFNIQLFSLEENDTIVSDTETYTICTFLGQGAFGEVYSAVTSSGNQVAIKSYKESLFKEGFCELFADSRHEFEVGQQLNHPHIVKSFDLIETKDTNDQAIYYLVMELISGKNLSLTARKTLNPDEAIAAMQQLIDALQYARSEGLYHIDLHSGNVMIAQDSSFLKVIDLASFITMEEYLNIVLHKSVLSPSPSPRELKIREFIKNNPQLKPAQRLKSISQNPSALIRQYQEGFHAVIFERISSICFTILSKTALSKEDKIALQVEIKKLAWSYTEDIAEGDYSQPLEERLTKLEHLIQSIDISH